MARLLGGADLAGAPEQGRLVGRNIEIDGRRYAVKAQIAKGGFATSICACQADNGAWYALKSQVRSADSAESAAIEQAIRLLEQSSHPHIIQYVGSAIATTGTSKEFLMITELCSGGSVVDLLAAGNPLPLAQVANIVHGAAAAIAYLHAKSPAVTHRDMKVENLLFTSRGVVKLCDFGSATTEEFFPDETWNAARRSQLEEQSRRATTPMYRAPEILDTRLGYPVTRLQDVWALGCVLYYICYRSHPFEDAWRREKIEVRVRAGEKRRILCANYNFPEEDREQYAPFRPLIERTLQPNPRLRPTAADLQQRIIEAFAASSRAVRVDAAVRGVDTTALTGGEPVVGVARGGRMERRDERRPERQGRGLFSHLKEKSAAVTPTVQNAYARQPAAAPPTPPPLHRRAASLAASAAAAAPALSDRFESVMLDSKEAPIFGKSTSPNPSMSAEMRDEDVDVLGSAASSRPTLPAAAAAAASSSTSSCGPTEFNLCSTDGVPLPVSAEGEAVRQAQIAAAAAAAPAAAAASSAEKPPATYTEDPAVLAGKIYVGGIAASVTRPYLDALLSLMGEVAQLITPSQPYARVKFALAAYEETAAAQRAIRILNGVRVGRSELMIRQASKWRTDLPPPLYHRQQLQQEAAPLTTRPTRVIHPLPDFLAATPDAASAVLAIAISNGMPSMLVGAAPPQDYSRVQMIDRRPVPPGCPQVSGSRSFGGGIGSSAPSFAAAAPTTSTMVGATGGGRGVVPFAPLADLIASTAHAPASGSVKLPKAPSFEAVRARSAMAAGTRGGEVCDPLASTPAAASSASSTSSMQQQLQQLQPARTTPGPPSTRSTPPRACRPSRGRSWAS